MQLKIKCELTNEQITIDYRRKIVMLMKKGLSETNPSLFEELYSENKLKEYTFSVYFKDAVFKKEDIQINSKEFVINFSTGNAELAVNFYNAFLSLKGQQIPFSGSNQVKIYKVSLVPQVRSNEEQVIATIKSPIICREHNRETKKDWFYTFEDTRFESVLKKNLTYQLKPIFGNCVEKDILDLQIENIKMKKTVVLCYDRYLACTIGRLSLSGKPYLVNYFLDNGFGSMTGLGFGMVEAT
ncbi:CRISPR-associated endoribonuclease Cas6 [Enterococcus rivorum]|uniref:CRISPR-associated endoribonuclease Cas6 n=1 Tax=Enterococcus rivorum TaxID=762845 RepID=A0A1E5KXC2_9ENTE|nr:CRISPR-associated endoribonuclease Cas6 [Enterococcus rivorum]MBP2100006.1 CRISPR-associated endoribonuclease Cas6 [Enterococcus rivorum]OEH82468.1 CRISPR-associated endoribonuclease Cas6 [Enterococcus rivorum]